MSDWTIAIQDPNGEGLFFPDDLPELADSPEWSLLRYDDDGGEGWETLADGLTVQQAEDLARELNFQGVPIGGEHAL